VVKGVITDPNVTSRSAARKTSVPNLQVLQDLAGTHEAMKESVFVPGFLLNPVLV
jgi:hypothetical protein